MSRRALLTEREREILSGDADDVENLSQYQSKIRTRLKGRLDLLERDMALLEEAEPKLADEVKNRVCDDGESWPDRIERELAELRKQVDDSNE